MNESKYNRKVLRRLDKTVARQSIYSAAACVVVYSFIALYTNLFSEFPRFAFFITASLMLVLILRIILALQFEKIYSRGPARWRSLFAVVMTSYAVIWSILEIGILYHFDISSYFFILLLFSIGVATTFLDTWMSSVNAARVFMAATFIPPAAFLLTLLSLDAYLLSIVVVLFYISIEKIGVNQFEIFWKSVATTQDLREKTRDLDLQVHGKSEANNVVNSEFIANLSREIREPMNNLVGMISLLGDTDLSKEQRNYQQLAAHSGDLLLSFFDDVIDYSKILDRKITLHQVVFNLRSCIEECADILAPVAQKKGMEIDCIYDSHLPVRVKGDSERFSQVMTNLISNAIKYGDEKNISIDVTSVLTSENECEIKVIVRDSGSGISQTQQDRLFTGSLGEQLGRSSMKGAGIGLAVSKGIVQAMGGNIGVSSEVGEGSKFWFSVQFRIANEMEKHHSWDELFVNKKALLVGTSKAGTRAMEMEMQELGVDLIAKKDLDCVIPLLENTCDSTPFDLVIFNSTGKNTLAVSEEVINHKHVSSIHQLIMCSLMERGRKSVLEYGNTHPKVTFLTKPMNRTKLYDAFSRLLQVDEPVAQGWQKQAIDDESPLMVLLAEDDKVSRMVAISMLNKLGYNYRAVGNGKEVLGILQDQNFDLILMDCNMPELDGYEASTRIREMEKNAGQKRIPIIAMTANVLDGEEARCLAAGMDDYLPKPVKLEAMHEKIRHWTTEVTSAEGVINFTNKEDHGWR